MPSHLAKRTDSYMRSCSLYKIPHSLSHKEPSYHLCRVILAFWSLFATPSGTLGLGKRDIHSRHIELTPPLTNETTFTLERLTSLILYPWDWCRYHQLTPMEYRKVTQTDEYAVLWSWYATLTHLCCLYTVPYAICDVSIVTVPVWGQGVCSSVIRGAFVIALEWIMVGRSSCHHHWLFWDLNAWLDACKSCILTTNPQLLRWIYVEYKQKEKRCSFQTALCLQSIEWWKSLNFSEPPTQSDHMTPTQSEHLAPHSIWTHGPLNLITWPQLNLITWPHSIRSHDSYKYKIECSDRVSHDSSVGKMNPTVSPLCGPGSIPGHEKVFQGIFLADHHLPTRPEPAWRKMAQSPFNGTIKFVEIEEEAVSLTMDRRRLEDWFWPKIIYKIDGLLW